MTRKYTLIYSLLFCCGSLLSFISSAKATTPSFDCTPVVYAFRHAEDKKERVEPPFPCLPGSPIKCTTALEPVGKEHADLYTEMITSFELAQDYCPVGFVYSVNPVNPDGFGGTTNPFYTGRPLANTVMNLDPLIEIGGDIIDQKLTVVKPAVLHDVLLGIAKSGSSVALFWTSEGLHALSLALGTDIIPEKTATVSPPRNAAYVFKYNGGSEFIPPPKPDEYIQCFNYASFSRASDNFTSKYYCGYGSHANLSVPEKDFDKLHGRICATALLTKVEAADYYGYCESPPAGSPP